MKNFVFSILFFLTILGCQSQDRHPESIRLLILSGSNNHNWQKTTPFLKMVFVSCGYFKADVTTQPAIFISDYGKGRIFYTLLGHDVRAMRNTGFQTLILRGTEWAATSNVSLPIPNSD